MSSVYVEDFLDTNKNEMYYDVIEYSIEAFVAEIVSRVKDGWVVNPSNPGDSLPFVNTFIVSMVRNDSTVKALKNIGEAITEAPKPSRAEILQKAREAKADKAAKLDVNKINP